MKVQFSHEAMAGLLPAAGEIFTFQGASGEPLTLG